VATHVIVDGYNVIHATSRYREVAERDIEAAREVLIADVAAYAQGEVTATIVFDGAANPRSDGQAHSVAGVEVVFSAYRKDADTVVEDLAGTHRRAGEEVLVVTSDAQTQWVVMGQGATRMSSAELVGNLDEMDGEMGEHASAGSGKATIEERIDEATRRRLRRWAEGAGP
jgi:predicted RNA-binding protein with PIN domain